MARVLFEMGLKGTQHDSLCTPELPGLGSDQTPTSRRWGLR